MDRTQVKERRRTATHVARPAKVQEVEGLYVRVATDDATADGWVRAGDLVEPTRLTGDATVTAPASGSDKVVTADLTAASRMLTGGQFSVKTEKTETHKATHHAKKKTAAK